MKIKAALVALLMSASLLTGCQSNDEPVHDKMVKPQPMSYYRVIRDGHHNVICVETHDKLNFYKCSAADYRWMDKHGIKY